MRGETYISYKDLRSHHLEILNKNPNNYFQLNIFTKYCNISDMLKGVGLGLGGFYHMISVVRCV